MGIHKITFAYFLVLVPADVGLPRSSVAQTSQFRPDLLSRWDTVLSHTLYRSWRRGSPSDSLPVTAGYRRDQVTSTKELWTGVIGRVAALLSSLRVTIHTSLIAVSISIMISCHNIRPTLCARPISSPSSQPYSALPPLLGSWHISGVSVLGGRSRDISG